MFVPLYICVNITLTYSDFLIENCKELTFRRDQDVMKWFISSTKIPLYLGYVVIRHTIIVVSFGNS